MPMTAQSIERGQDPGSRTQYGYEFPHENCYGYFVMGLDRKTQS